MEPREKNGEPRLNVTDVRSVCFADKGGLTGDSGRERTGPEEHVKHIQSEELEPGPSPTAQIPVILQ